MMRFTGPTLIMVGMILSPTARCQDANLPDRPYDSIIARNMFGLLPIPTVDPHANDPVDPPPKITPTGIMTIFGRDQALFKVSNTAKPGQPAKDNAYVLSEGERQDDIEVTKIDHVDGKITFNNHGTIQELPLVPAKDSGGSSDGSPPGFAGGSVTIPRPGIFPRPNMSRTLTIPAGPGSTFGMGNPNGNGNGNGMGNPNGNGGSQANANRVYQPEEDPSITPEQSVILMEAQRMKYLQDGNQRMATMIPPTPLTQRNLQENGGGQ
jgi:hypothetical protein